MDDTKVEDEKAPDQQQGATPEAEQEPDIVKVDEAAVGEAKADDIEPQSPPAAKPEPSKATKGPIKLKVVLLEGKDLDLEEKVPGCAEWCGLFMVTRALLKLGANGA